MNKELILTICAHNDDQIAGAGGTLAKYSENGKKVKTIVLSYGELSPVYLKPEIVIKKRIKESYKADKKMGGEGVEYLGIKDSKLKKEFENNKVKQKIKQIIQKEKPKKIFTHSNDDIHPDHQAVNTLIKEIIKELKKEKKYLPEIYTFQVWHIMKTKKTNNPKLIVDITKTFNKKINSLKEHKSQKLPILLLLWNIYLKAIINGIIYGYKYAEVFEKIA